MAFSAGLSELEALYSQYAEELFSLCFLHTAKSGEAFSLMRTALCDLAYSRRQWEWAQNGREGVFRAVYQSCMDYCMKYPRGKRKRKRGKSPSPEASVGAALPFSLTEALRAILHLPVKYKAPLYLCLARGWSAEAAAQVVGGSAARVEKLVNTALKKLDMSREKAASALSSLSAGEDALQRVWDHFLVDREDRGFAGKQRLRRFKRWLDNAIPYIAMGAVAFCVLAYFAVEYGWLSGTPYEPAAPLEGYTASGYYGNSPAPASAVEYETGDVAIYVPENGAFVKYVVAGCPLSVADVTKQAVSLGGLPEGVSLLSVSAAREDGAETSPDTAGGEVFSLSLEFSQEAADYFSAASPADREAMLKAMTCTYGELFSGLETIRFTSAGEELSADGRAAQNFLGDALEISRTTETEYRT